MKRILTIAAVAAASIGVAACDDYDETNNAAYNETDNAAYGAEAGNAAYGDGAGNAAYGAATAATELPQGARVVVENGVRYRIDPGGARVRLGDGDSVIWVEDGVRYRIDPEGTRFRVDDRGVRIDIGDGDVDATVDLDRDPSIAVNTNR
jgi:hypothetical protein